jgi:hypothetical protein
MWGDFTTNVLGKPDSQLSAAEIARKEAALRVTGNVVWEGLKKRGLDPNNDDDYALMKFIVGLTGTVIIPNPEEAAAGVKQQFVKGEFSFKDMTSADNATATVRVPYCTIDRDRCMTMDLEDDLGVNRIYEKVSTDMVWIVVAAFNHLTDPTAAGGAITTERQNLLASIKIPVVGLLQAAWDVDPNIGWALYYELSDYIVKEISYDFVLEASNIARSAAFMAPGSKANTDAEILIRHIDTVMKEATEDVLPARQQMGGIIGTYRKINELRTMAMEKFAPNMAHRLHAAKRYTAQR